jgi:hypothetical protein
MGITTGRETPDIDPDFDPVFHKKAQKLIRGPVARPQRKD